MKKNVIVFKAPSGGEYNLTVPTIDVRMELLDTMGYDDKEAAKNLGKNSLAFARAGLPEDFNINALSIKEVFEIGNKVYELLNLGK